MTSSSNTAGVTSFTDSVPLSWSYPCPCEGQIVVTMESRDRPTEVSVVLHIQHRGGYPTSRCQHFAKGVQAEEMRRLQALMDQTREQIHHSDQYRHPWARTP